MQNLSDIIKALTGGPTLSKTQQNTPGTPQSTVSSQPGPTVPQGYALKAGASNNAELARAGLTPEQAKKLNIQVVGPSETFPTEGGQPAAPPAVQKQTLSSGQNAPGLKTDTPANTTTSTPTTIQSLGALMDAMGSGSGIQMPTISADLTMPTMAAGGVVEPGGHALVGESGPEVISTRPDGSVQVVPVTQQVADQLLAARQQATAQGPHPLAVGETPPPSAAEQHPLTAPFSGNAPPTVATGEAPAPGIEPFGSVGQQPGVFRKVGQALLNTLVGAAVGNTGTVNSILNSRRAAQDQRQHTLVQIMLQHPEMLTSSPEGVAAFEASMGPGSAQAYLNANDPGTQLRNNLQLAEKLIEPTRALGMGLSVSPQGATVTLAPPSPYAQGASAASKTIQEYLQNGADPLSAAKATLKVLGAQGKVPPGWLTDLAFAETKNDIAVALERAKATIPGEPASLAATQQSAFASGYGSAAGKAQAEAQMPLMPITVQSIDGKSIQVLPHQTPIIAATGRTDARPLGKNPSDAQLAQAVHSGQEVITGSDGQLYSIPAGSTIDAIPALSVSQGAQIVPAIQHVTQKIQELVGDPRFASAFPSEKALGKTTARGVGWVQSWIRGMTDDARTIRLRAEVLSLGFEMARLHGSNSQLSDAERKAAMGPWEKIANGTATQEQIAEAVRGTMTWLRTLNPNVGQDRTPKGTLGVPSRTPTASPSTTSTTLSPRAEKLFDMLMRKVSRGEMSEEQAAQRLSQLTAKDDAKSQQADEKAAEEYLRSISAPGP